MVDGSGTHDSGPYDEAEVDAFLLVVKGNLRHRIDLLGVEALEEALDETQRRLRSFVRALPATEDPGSCPERPDWASGAFVCLRPHEMEVARRIFEHPCQGGVQLQSKHVLVSRDLYPLVKELLDAKPQGP